MKLGPIGEYIVTIGGDGAPQKNIERTLSPALIVYIRSLFPSLPSFFGVTRSLKKAGKTETRLQYQARDLCVGEECSDLSNPEALYTGSVIVSYVGQPSSIPAPLSPYRVDAMSSLCWGGDKTRALICRGRGRGWVKRLDRDWTVVGPSTSLHAVSSFIGNLLVYVYACDSGVIGFSIAAAKAYNTLLSANTLNEEVGKQTEVIIQAFIHCSPLPPLQTHATTARL